MGKYMKYGDIEIVSILNQHKKGITGDIETGLLLKEDIYHFHRTMLCNRSFSMMLPLRFLVSSQEEIKSKYGSNSPVEIFCNRAGTIEINFNYYGDETIRETPTDIVNSFEILLKRLNPGIKTYEKKEKTIREISICWIDYKCETIVSSVYNIFFAMSIEDKKYRGQFMCGLKDAILWKPVFLNMLDTLQIEICTKEMKDGISM